MRTVYELDYYDQFYPSIRIRRLDQYDEIEYNQHESFKKAKKELLKYVKEQKEHWDDYLKGTRKLRKKDIV